MLLMLMTFSLTSCFVFDLAPGVKIKIEKSILPEIDSISLLEVSQDSIWESGGSIKITPNKQSYFLYTFFEKARIQIHLNNSTKVLSDSIFGPSHSHTIIISGNDGVIAFNQVEKNKKQTYLSGFLLVFAILLITKVPVATLIIKPNSKLRFMMLFAGLNFLYLLIFVVLLIFLKELLLFMLYPIYLIVLLTDTAIFLRLYREGGISRPILAGVISNFLFLTIGQFAITFLAMSLIS